MGETMLAGVQALMLSPWLYAVIVGLAVLDAFVPLVPSETAVLLAGTWAAIAGPGPDLVLVIVAGAVGALAGDHLAYAAARGLGATALARARPASRTGRAYAWAREATERRGGPVLLAARFVPGGRTAMTLTMGATRFPLRSFTAYDALACVVWATWCAGLGFVGGHVFSVHPVIAVGCGMAVSMAVAGLVETASRRRVRPVAP